MEVGKCVPMNGLPCSLLRLVEGTDVVSSKEQGRLEVRQVVPRTVMRARLVVLVNIDEAD